MLEDMRGLGLSGYYSVEMVYILDNGECCSEHAYMKKIEEERILKEEEEAEWEKERIEAYEECMKDGDINGANLYLPRDYEENEYIPIKEPSYGLLINEENEVLDKIFNEEEFYLSDPIHSGYYQEYPTTIVYVFYSYHDLLYAIDELREKLEKHGVSV